MVEGVEVVDVDVDELEVVEEDAAVEDVDDRPAKNTPASKATTASVSATVSAVRRAPAPIEPTLLAMLGPALTVPPLGASAIGCCVEAWGRSR